MGRAAGIYEGSATVPTVTFADSIEARGVHLLFGPITTGSAKSVVEWILQGNFRVPRAYEELTLIILSSGGDVDAAFAIIDAIEGSALPVRVVATGEVASAALMIATPGDLRAYTQAHFFAGIAAWPYALRLAG